MSKSLSEAAKDVLEGGNQDCGTYWKIDRDDIDALRIALASQPVTVEELAEALRGMVSIETSVTQGQEKDRRNEWMPKARALLSRMESGK